MTDDQLVLSAEGAKLPGRVSVDRFAVRQGECVVLCGPNGSGKSSLLRLLAGLDRSDQGSVNIGALNVATASRREIAQHLAWLPQRPYLADTISCEAIVAAARFRFQESPGRALAQAHNILEAQGIAHLASRPAQQVSGGELQRVLFASLIAQEAPFLLVDEPANHLDPKHQMSAYRALGSLWREQGRAVILVTHDVRLATLLGPSTHIRVAGVKDGRLLPETHLDAPQLKQLLDELYGVPFVDPGLPGGLAVELSDPGSAP